jgi:hypothetical protein
MTEDITPSTSDDSGSVPVPQPEGATPEITFQGNNYDLMAVVGVTIGVTVLISCFTLNLIWYCLPVVAVILGVVGLSVAKDSVNPERTRQLSWISLGTGSAILALVILGILAYIGIIVFAIAAEGGGF